MKILRIFCLSFLISPIYYNDLLSMHAPVQNEHISDNDYFETLGFKLNYLDNARLHIRHSLPVELWKIDSMHNF